MLPALAEGLTNAHPKWEAERRAFVQLLPKLFVPQQGKYVAVHQGNAVESGDD